MVREVMAALPVKGSLHGGRAVVCPVQMECAGVALASEGVCEPRVYKNRTTTGGDTGSGSGEAGNIEDCICALIYDPVCGADGVTYGNVCQVTL